MAALSTSLATQYLLLKPKPPFFTAAQTAPKPLTITTHSLSSQKCIIVQTRPRIRRFNAVSVDSESIVADTAGELVSATGDSNGDGVSTIISVLLFVAFIGLSILTIGVVYLGVTDFLQKRERDKLEKEEAANKKKKSGKKGRVRARTGPKGFGQKVQIEDDF